MNQRKKNIRLLLILASLCLMIVLIWIFQDRRDPGVDNRDLFMIADVSEINKVSLESKGGEDLHLEYSGNRWKVQDTVEADPNRISILFAVLNQVKVRREVSMSQNSMVDSLFEASGVKVSGYSDQGAAFEFYVAGLPGEVMTFFRQSSDAKTYVVHIPGYQTYLAGIFQLNWLEWKNPILFPINWRNLAVVQVTHAVESDSFSIIPKDGFFGLEELEATDTTAMSDFLDALSLIYADQFFLPSDPEGQQIIPEVFDVEITVRDIGQRQHVLKLSISNENNDAVGILNDGLIVTMSKARARKIIKLRTDFLPGKNPIR